ncbi:unnamed protein product [Colias eurytheme]|nr:unnamed protein product [Colias eurytheme]
MAPQAYIASYTPTILIRAMITHHSLLEHLIIERNRGDGGIKVKWKIGWQVKPYLLMEYRCEDEQHSEVYRNTNTLFLFYRVPSMHSLFQHPSLCSDPRGSPAQTVVKKPGTPEINAAQL